MKALEFKIKDNNLPCRGYIYLTTKELQDMYKVAKYTWEHRSDWSGDEFWSERVHTLEEMIQEAKKGKCIFLKT